MSFYKSLDDQIKEVIQYINSIDNFTFDINGFSILGGHLASLSISINPAKVICSLVDAKIKSQLMVILKTYKYQQLALKKQNKYLKQQCLATSTKDYSYSCESLNWKYHIANQINSMLSLIKAVLLKFKNLSNISKNMKQELLKSNYIFSSSEDETTHQLLFQTIQSFVKFINSQSSIREQSIFVAQDEIQKEKRDVINLLSEVTISTEAFNQLFSNYKYLLEILLQNQCTISDYSLNDNQGNPKQRANICKSLLTNQIQFINKSSQKTKANFQINYKKAHNKQNYSLNENNGKNISAKQNNFDSKSYSRTVLKSQLNFNSSRSTKGQLKEKKRQIGCAKCEIY